MLKKIILGVLIVVLVAYLSAWLGVKLGNRTIIESIEKITNQINELNLGAINNIPQKWFSYGEVTTYRFGGKMEAASSTRVLCVITPKERGNGTSTIDRLLLSIPTSTSTISTIVAATSTNAGSTTTLSSNFMKAMTVAANAKAMLSWSPAPNTNVVGPKDYILVMTEGAGLSGYTYDDGYCRAEFTSF